MLKQRLVVAGTFFLVSGSVLADVTFRSDFEGQSPYGFALQHPAGDGSEWFEEAAEGWNGQGSRLVVRRGREQFNLGWYGDTGGVWEAGDVIFVRFRIRFDDDWRWDGNGSQQNKLVDIGLGDGSGDSRFILHQESPHPTTPCGLSSRYGGGEYGSLSLKKGITFECTRPVIITYGRWHHVQLAVRASTEGGSDGYFKLWVDNNDFDEPSSQREGTSVTGTDWTEFGFGGFWTDANGRRDQGFVVDDFEIATDFDADWAPGGPGGSTQLPPLGGGNTGLPVIMDFDTGDFSQFNSAAFSQVPEITNSGCLQGGFCARAGLSPGTHSDFFVYHELGDNPNSGLEKLEEAYLTLHSRISADYVWPNDTQKIAIWNITDTQSSQRRYQVILVVFEDGRYGIDLADFGDLLFSGLHQNRNGAPVSPAPSGWDHLKLHVRLNTPGADNGIVRLWVNNVLKLERQDLDIREDTDYGIGRFILSSYAEEASGSHGVQWWDNVLLSADDPGDGVVVPDPPTLLGVE